MAEIRIVSAQADDVPIILGMIRGLAEYEKLSHVVVATEDRLRRTLFGKRPAAEVLLAYQGDACSGFALFFNNYSTFLAKPGITGDAAFSNTSLYVRVLLPRASKLTVARPQGRWKFRYVQVRRVEFLHRFGVLGRDVTVTDVLADDRAVLAFHQRVVLASIGPALGEFHEQLPQHRGHLVVDELGTVVGMKAQNAEGKLMQDRLQHRHQKVLADPAGTANHLPLRDRIDRVDVIHTFDPVPIALMPSCPAWRTSDSPASVRSSPRSRPGFGR